MVAFAGTVTHFTIYMELLVSQIFGNCVAHNAIGGIFKLTILSTAYRKRPMVTVAILMKSAKLPNYNHHQINHIYNISFIGRLLYMLLFHI